MVGCFLPHGPKTLLSPKMNLNEKKQEKSFQDKWTETGLKTKNNTLWLKEIRQSENKIKKII